MTGRRSPEAIESFRANPDDPRHGTPNGYKNYGCRCAACRAARSKEQKKEKAARSQRIDPDDPRHGTHSFYVAHGCRCVRCRAANSTSCREWRGTIPSPPVLADAGPFRRNPDDPRHGSEDGYALGCRCRRCRAAVR